MMSSNIVQPYCLSNRLNYFYFFTDTVSEIKLHFRKKYRKRNSRKTSACTNIQHFMPF